MARNLYRFYLYIVYIALLIFIAGAISGLLSTLLLFTPLRGSYETIPGQAQVIQSLTFAGVAVLVAGAIAGLHYWLIRRDRRNDPDAGTSAIRAFFLNITEAISISLSVPLIGFGVILPLAQAPGSNVVFAASLALPALALATLLEVERRQTLVTSRTALAFQRLHFYGVQLFLLIVLSLAWYGTIRPMIDSLFGGTGLQQACSSGDYCPQYNVFGLAVGALWFVAAWIGYGWLVRKDTSSLLRFILHGLQFAYGVGFMLFGLYSAIKLLLFLPFHVAFSAKEVLGPSPSYDVISPLTLGILVALVYNWWLRIGSKQHLIESVTLILTENAIVALLAAAAFWWGLGNLLYAALQTWTPVSDAPDQQSWPSALAFIIVGAGYFALDLYLRRRSIQNPTIAEGPRRGFVLALLGAGILAFAIGGVTALYSWITAVFGSPVSDWQQATHVGLAAFAVGAVLITLYLRIAFREHLLSGLGKKSASTPSAPLVEPTSSPTLELILDDLLTSKISRDEAIRRIQALYKVPISVTSS